MNGFNLYYGINLHFIFFCSILLIIATLILSGLVNRHWSKVIKG